MFPETQIFEAVDIRTVVVLVLLEGLLSADNALVLAIMVRHLPTKLQKKALLYGLGGAFVFRFIAILMATLIIQLWWLQLVGAGYLAWITIKHFVKLRQEGNSTKQAKEVVAKSFWATVVAVELTDIAFAVDSVVAAVALEPNKAKIWVVYTGAIAGVILLRFAASAFIKLLDKYPMLEHLAYVLIGWVSIKLGMMSMHNFTITDAGKSFGIHVPEMPHTLFWVVMGILVIGGTAIAISRASVRAADTVETESESNESDSSQEPEKDIVER